MAATEQKFAHETQLDYLARVGCIPQTLRRAIELERGPASEHPCSRCGEVAKVWAYDGKDLRGEKIYFGGKGRTKPTPTSSDAAFFEAMCRRCVVLAQQNRGE